MKILIICEKNCPSLFHRFHIRHTRISLNVGLRTAEKGQIKEVATKEDRPHGMSRPMVWIKSEKFYATRILQFRPDVGKTKVRNPFNVHDGDGHDHNDGLEGVGPKNGAKPVAYTQRFVNQ